MYKKMGISILGSLHIFFSFIPNENIHSFSASRS
ncbi:hypothetical protein protein [Bacillus cereus G9241]|nr:hypothetical protein protein [Bacillus cereus G9241]